MKVIKLYVGGKIKINDDDDDDIVDTPLKISLTQPPKTMYVLLYREHQRVNYVDMEVTPVCDQAW